MIIGPGWMAVYPDPAVARKIVRWARDTCGFTHVEPAKELHITQLFIGGKDRYDIIPNKQRTYQCRFNQVEAFGPEHDTLVLLITSPSLHARFREFKQVGYQHTYPTYEPHITIREDAHREDLATARKYLPQLKMELPSFSVSGEVWQKTKND